MWRAVAVVFITVEGGTVALCWQSLLDVHLRPTCPGTAANVPVITVVGAELKQEPAKINLCAHGHKSTRGHFHITPMSSMYLALYGKPL